MDGCTDVWMDGRADVWTDGWTEFLPILQDFVPLLRLLPRYSLELNNIRGAGKGKRWPYAFEQLVQMSMKERG